MNKTFLAIAISAIALSGSTVAAPGDAVPHIFSNGTTADADQVNSNFAALVSQISALVPATHSFRDYSGSSIGTKVFSVQDTEGGYDQEVRVFNRSVAGQVSYTRNRTLTGSTVQYHTITLDNSGPELRFIKFERNDLMSPATVIETRTMSPGVLIRTENMEEGKTFGSDSALHSTTATPADSGVIQTTTLIASNQSVTVNGVNYSGCIKTARHRSSSKLGAYDMINTLCPNVGLVRSVKSQSYFDGGNLSDTVSTLKTQTVLTELLLCDGATCTP
ncbi:MAG: hypothetical protein OEY11_12725 [Gammaproteobacteria bacterium]|nr:hypothetical protein [Gammaproteobacteria bacterium]